MAKGMTRRTLSCACGTVRFEATGDPILTGVCYCADCQAGARKIEALGDGPPALDPDGGASYLTYRDDRFACVAGEALLDGVKLSERAPTTRYRATCCNSAMYLKFHAGHWVSTFRNRYAEAAHLPDIEMRTNLRARNSDLPLPDDAPGYRRFPLKLFARLIGARIAMALGR